MDRGAPGLHPADRERLLLEDGTRSPARASDVRVPSATGGQERGRADFERSVGGIGFEVKRTFPRIDMSVPVCRTSRTG
ncbi:hypothetical protein [Saccharothrix longispora]|uniref:hypothetical protein n=1 Tax=Saccharothrix longispora TaxID=33920 RepID=UPI0028FD9A17|nr:hypothetical protein [Saccharothrix longispora]MBY8849061.1 hypothetical protein [Saccharothrix sp. MB29]MDU0288305.1 hypothetical protein [Saccharothrix longispora]